MKAILSVSIILIVFLLAGAGCLAVLDIITYEGAIDFSIKSTVSISILGIASAIIAFLNNGNSTKD